MKRDGDRIRLQCDGDRVRDRVSFLLLIVYNLINFDFCISLFVRFGLLNLS